MEVIEYIPEKYEDGFIALYNMSKKDFEVMLNAISKLPLVSSPSNLVRQVSPDLEISMEDIQDVFFSIESLIPLVDKKIEKEEIINQLTTVIKKTELLVFSDDEEKVFRDRLLALLNSEKVYYAVKADELITENAIVFLDSKIVTDIRPIFQKDAQEKPKVGIVTHTLQIHYRTCENSTHQTIFLSIDSNDIEALQENLERAVEKTKTLIEVLDKSEMQSIVV